MREGAKEKGEQRRKGKSGEGAPLRTICTALRLVFFLEKNAIAHSSKFWFITFEIQTEALLNFLASLSSTKVCLTISTFSR
jgi:hypothetical protein